MIYMSLLKLVNLSFEVISIYSGLDIQLKDSIIVEVFLKDCSAL